VKFIKHLRISGLCFAALGVMVVCGFGTAGSASAEILFLPNSHIFPYHLVGTGGLTRLLTANSSSIESKKVDILLLVLSQTLFDAHFRFLETGVGSSTCTSPGESAGTVLIRLLGHFGLADPGFIPAVLLLVPNGFKFTCVLGPISQTVLVRGGVIGRIASPAVNEDSELLKLLFNETASHGVQDLTTFLLGGQALTNQIEESSQEEGAFEQSGQSGPLVLLHALPGEGPFLLILP